MSPRCSRAGRAAEVLPEAERTAAAEPLRERSQSLLAEALAGTGQVAEALRCVDRYRRILADETGLDPGPAIVALEHQLFVGQTTTPVDRGRSTVLPRPGSLLGRARELDELAAVIERERLVAVVGPGGVGKTRLVAELLHHRKPPCVVVELAGVGAHDVGSAIAGSVGSTAGSDDPIGVAAELLSVSPVLLVLDNVEHVVAPVAAALRRVLDTASGVRVLVTSRVRLGLPEEHVVALAPLAWGAHDSPAVTLFLERLRRGTGARAISDGEVADAQTVCEKLDGIPLAVELAAGRAVALGTAELVRGLDEALDFAHPDDSRPARHGTLRATVEWSYDLLAPVDQDLLDRLGVFEGDFTLDAAAAVAQPGGSSGTAAGVARLVDASLLVALPDGRLRLLDPVRRFAQERLRASSSVSEVRSAHADWVATLFDEVAAAVAGSGDAAADARLRTHMDDVRAALRTALTASDAPLAARLARSLSTMSIYRPDGELLAWARRAADEPTLVGPDVRAAAARAAYLQGDVGAAKALADHLDVAVAHHAIGVVALYEGDHDAALHAFSAAADAPDVTLAARLDALAGSALTRCYAGDLDGGRATLAAQRLLAESAGSDTYRAFADYVAGELALADGDDGDAVASLRAAIRRARAVRADFVVGVASTALLSALVRVGAEAEAAVTAVDLIDLWWRTATWPQQWTTLRLAADLLVDGKAPDVALLVLAAADLDAAAPAVVGDDAVRLAALRDQLATAVGAGTVETIVEVAAQLPRATVVRRARQVLAELAESAESPPAREFRPHDVIRA